VIFNDEGRSVLLIGDSTSVLIDERAKLCILGW
jgi:hypothetical protein